jgi:DNA (cytosine-5)-methyltransferase 1
VRILQKLRALDLCCCAGGVSAGLVQAGFDVTGIDIEPQTHYPFNFIQADALGLDTEYLRQFDFLWASPNCQEYSMASMQFRLKGKQYPTLIEALRVMFIESGKPYVIENVEGAPLINPIMLCGTMFGIKTYRHRIFEANFPINQPAHGEHDKLQVKMGRPVKQGDYIQMVGHFSGVQYAREITGCYWMNQYELAQCIPPAYSKYIAQQYLQYAGIMECCV